MDARPTSNPHAQRLLLQLKQAGKLPAAPGAAARVVQLCQREGVQLADLCDAIAVDPALSGQVLKLANCAAFNNGEPMLSVRQAVLMLGTRAVMVAAMNMAAETPAAQPGQFDLTHFWLQSVGTAVTARHLAPHCKLKVDREEAFTAGLLAAVGQLALAQAMGKQYLISVAGATDEMSLLEKEREAFGVDNVEFAAHLLAHWQLPDRLVQVVRWQHDPGSAEEALFGPTLVLHVALRVTPLFLAPQTLPAREQVEARKLLKMLHLSNETIADVTERTVAEFGRVSAMLHLTANDKPAANSPRVAS